MSSGWDDLFALVAGDPESFTKPIPEKDDGEVIDEMARKSSLLCPKTRKEEEENAGLSKSGRSDRKKKKKRSRERNSHDDDDLTYLIKEQKRHKKFDDNYECGTDIVLKSRINLPTKLSLRSIFGWPKWMKLGSSLINKRKCKGWESPCSTSMNFCESCKLSPLHHEIEFDKKACIDVSSNYKKVLNLFLGVRNIRACASCAVSAVSHSSDNQQTIENKIELYAQAAARKTENLEHLLYNMTNTFLSSTQSQMGEAHILEQKYQNLVQSAEKWCAKDKTSKEELINLIIACDAMYYRLYYLQITELLPQIAGDVPSNKKDKLAFIPHPPIYFGVPYICWHVEQGYACMRDFIRHYTIEACNHQISSRDGERNKNFNDAEELLSVLSNSAENVKKSQIHHELETAAQYLTLISKAADQVHFQDNDSNVLSYLHNNRMMETLLLFWKSGLYCSNFMTKATLKIVAKANKQSFKENVTTLKQATDEQFYVHHETPAQTTLMNWRDSCRDVLCNLYAYATIAPSTMIKIKKFFTEHGLSGGIVEVGAGTGYVAKEFGRAGLRIKAWDISPTSSVANEYHGNTPSFVTVKEGNDQVLSKYFSNPKCSQSAKNTALLLCYPPPRSKMAYNATRAFRGIGGKVIIHIGEYKGLTGSNDFEMLLKSSFSCKARYPCLGWGNDAASITIWFLKSENNVSKPPQKKHHSSTSILLPCSFCHKKEGIKRCRLGRSIVYCSNECFERHKKFRKIQLAFHAVHVFNKKEELIDFESDNSFVKI